MTARSDPTATFASAARSFAALVHEIPGDRWHGPGLGEWDLRSLVGHTSRSLITVSTYLAHAAEREDITTPQEYYARVNPAAGRPTGLAARIAVAEGHGETVLMALTGRAELPPSFSIV